MFAASVVEILAESDQRLGISDQEGKSDQRSRTGDQDKEVPGHDSPVASRQSPDPASSPIGEKAASQIAACYQQVLRIHQAEEASGYQVEKLLEAVN
jgi:hypothetical protein